MSIKSYAAGKPLNFFSTAEWACAALPLNAAARALNTDHSAHMAIKNKLDEMGQTHFISLARKCTESMISLSLYAGDGIVLKITPDNYYNQNPDHPYILPEISHDFVETNQHKYHIQTFPYVEEKNITADDIEEMRQKLIEIGMNFDKKDDKPRNFRRLPDASATLVGIDSGMTTYIEKREIHREDRTLLNQAWDEHIKTLYPVYADGKIKPQSQDTNFDLISIHDTSKSKTLQFTGKIIIPEAAAQNLTEATHADTPPHKIRNAFLSLFRRNDKDNDISIG